MEVVHAVAMASRFLVDPVQRATDRPITRPLSEQLGASLLLGGEPERPVVDHGATHPLLGAVHRAFAEHRPLVLTPDVVWLTIAHGVARHVHLNAETLRRRLVRHDGRERITLEVSELPDSGADWGEVVEAFRDALADRIGDGPARLFECDFSTSTEVERLAGRVVLMDAYTPFYDYQLECICGIPWVRLEGTVEDWRRIRERVDVLAELDLETWARSLRPICDELVKAADGAPTLSFWRRLYKPVDAYGGDVVTGWIARLYPYVIAEGAASRPNPLLALPIDEPSGHSDGWYSGPGVRPHDIPAEASRARIRVVDHPRGEVRDVSLEAGVMAVGLEEDGALAPLCAWVLRADPALSMLDVIARIREEHVAVELTPEDATSAFFGNAELVALRTELAEARLFDGRWRLRGRTGEESIDLAAKRDDPGLLDRFWRLLGRGRNELIHLRQGARPSLVLDRALDLDDGTYVAVWSTPGARPLLVRGRAEALEPTDPGGRRRTTQRMDELRVVGTSLAELLWTAMEGGGSDALPDLGPLSESLPAWARPMG